MLFKKTGLSFLTLVLGASVSWASGFHSAVSDAASLGQATGGLTRVESATTAQDIPAAMPFLKPGIHATAGFLQSSASFEFSGAKGDGPTQTPAVVSAHVNGVWNPERPYAIGVTQNFPYNTIIDWGEDWVGREVVSSVDLSVGTTSPVVAYRFGDFALGGGIDFWEGTVNLKRTTLVIDDTNEVRSELGGSGESTGFNLSAYYQKNRISVGVQHHSSTTLKAEAGKVSFDTSDALAVSFTPRFPDGDVKVDLLLPSNTRMGVSFKEKLEDPQYMVEFTLNHTGWSNYRELRFRFDKPVGGSTESSEKKEWEDTTGYALSGKYVFSRDKKNSLLVRGGIFGEPSPIPKKYLDGVTPDTGREGIAFGLGAVFGHLLADFSILTETFAKGSSSHEDLPGDYNGRALVFSSTVGYSW